MISNLTLFLYVGVIFFISIMTTMIVWSRKETRMRVLGICLFLVSIPLGAGVFASTLGLPVPLIQGVTAPSGFWNILAVRIEINKAIYVYLDTPKGPRSYVLPWNPNTADKLSQGENNPETKGRGRMKILPFEFSWDEHEPTIEYTPQPKRIPDKPATDPQYEGTI